MLGKGEDMQIDRLFEIMYLLLERQTVSARELAERLEISTRTVYRDVERLGQAGMPVYATRGKGGGISLLPDFVLNKAALSREEKQHIAASVRAFASLQPGGDRRMPSKLAAMLDDSATDWIEVDFSSWSNPEEEKTRFETLRQAILERRAVSFLYDSARGERQQRTVEPLKLGFKSQAWYLFGYCRMRKADRFFKLSRMHQLTLLMETFQRAAPAQIFPQGNAFQEEYFRLRLRLAPELSFRAYEEFPNVVELPDGSLLVESNAPRGIWLFGYLASFGAGCEVLGPEEVRAEYAAEIREISRLYSEYDK